MSKQSKGIEKGQQVVEAMKKHCSLTGQSFMALYHLLYNSEGVEFSVISFVNSSGIDTITVDSAKRGIALITEHQPQFIKESNT